ncbi:CHASE2 domain-containing protein [Calothrix sp. CCY 0018]|uniref:CHASE2 domain-containing protein n=1 Tax=Calothrix sp. CCY 0018 TaxID=3103864 RepID=UPI0039C6CEBA
MAEDSTYNITKKYVSAAKKLLNLRKQGTSTVSAQSFKMMARLGHILSGASVVGAVLLAGSSSNLTAWIENQAESVFYVLRGRVTPPKDIVILAIDNESISLPKESYEINPVKYAYLEPLKSYPFQRKVYGEAIKKLIQAGARHVAIDILFDYPSSYGKDDDKQFTEVLERYGNKVTLAALYEKSESYQGISWQLVLPDRQFRTGSVSTGSANFPLEIDGKVHRLASVFPELLAEQDDIVPTSIPSFDQSVLLAAGIKYPQPKGDRINFYGGAGTFETRSFWNLFDPEFWDTNLGSGKFFKDKIVIIGSTARTHKGENYRSVAISSEWLYPEKMYGVEIHAHAIATLMQGKTIVSPLSTSLHRSLFVLFLVGGSTLIITRVRQGTNRLAASLVLAAIWFGISYSLFVYAQLILPTSLPIFTICTVGLCYFGTEVAREKLRKTQLVDILQRHASNRVVQEIISQQDDLKDLLGQRLKEISGKVLDGRYKIVEVLGSGGFSETYIAEDTRLPGNPRCVVKQLKPVNNRSEQLIVARRLFKSEAQTLQVLGNYNQIPQLLAYFEEEQEFYLVQEHIIGAPLSKELLLGKRLPEPIVIEMLKDILQTLMFVHNKGVIHRDIKPSNIMRRSSDQKLVLIDFGAVKQVSTQVLNSQEQTAFTIGIGTKGYAPREQCLGYPQYSSDIYAVGMIAIFALTGIPPHELPIDENQEVKWVDKATISIAFTQILSKMILDDHHSRYQSAIEVLQALYDLTDSTSSNLFTDNSLIDTVSLKDSDAPTEPWNNN